MADLFVLLMVIVNMHNCSTFVTCHQSQWPKQLKRAYFNSPRLGNHLTILTKLRP